jgi:hypothetical protein
MPQMKSGECLETLMPLWELEAKSSAQVVQPSHQHLSLGQRILIKMATQEEHNIL